MTDRPTTEPRTARERMRRNIAALRADDDRERYLRERFQWDCLAIEADAYDAAMVDAFDDVQRIDRAEAAQGAAPRQKSIEQLAAEKGIGPLKSADDLRIDLTDEEANAFMEAMEFEAAAPRAEGLDVERLFQWALTSPHLTCDMEDEPEGTTRWAHLARLSRPSDERSNDPTEAER